MISAVPIVMIKNEEVWIERVLRPLVNVFPAVLVGDTGSIDGTIDIVRSIPNVLLNEFGPKDARGLKDVRQSLTNWGRELGFQHVFLVDGDEIYSTKALSHIVNEGFPTSKRFGFTSMVNLDEDENGQLWELDNWFNRLALYPSTTRWSGDYPFEVPNGFADSSTAHLGYHYWTLPEGFRYHAIHVHRCRRSKVDYDVYMRVQKQKQYCLQDINIPRTIPFDADRWSKM